MHGDSADTIELPGFVVDLVRGELRDAAGTRVDLRAQSWRVLRRLAMHAGCVVGKDELMQAVWPGVVVTDDSLVQCIKDLRRALNDPTHAIVQTERKRGYRLAVRAAAAPLPVSSAARAQFQQDIRFATTADGTRIAYAISGDGPPLVRAAHWMTDLDWDWRSSAWGARIQRWSERFRLVRFDWRGCGMSDRDAVPGDLDACVSDLEAVVDAAGLKRFALIAGSGGAPSAIRYAARHPHRVSRLALLGPYARGHLRRGEGSVPRETFDAMQRLIEIGWGQDHPAFRQMFTSFMWPEATLEQLESFNHMQRVACAPKAAALMRSRMSQFDATPDLPHVQCPTLVLHSPRDLAVPFEEGRLIASMIPGATLEPFDSANHTPLPGEPAFDHVMRRIDEFLLGDEAGNVHPLADRHASEQPALRAVAAPTRTRAGG